ncbi:MAG TPA: hypothetical protein VJQ57_04245 [Acidimicrobiia bacterium]|nr:hypothetical protein [Acidimicrobiia bacterium]
MWRFIFIAFLIAHGGVHLAMWLSPVKPDAPFDAGRSWLVGEQRGLAVTLALAAAVLLVVGGVGLWLTGSWWRLIAVAALAFSFLLMILFFHPWLIPIQVINAALIVSLLWLDWPSEAMVGA